MNLSGFVLLDLTLAISHERFAFVRVSIHVHFAGFDCKLKAESFGGGLENT